MKPTPKKLSPRAQKRENLEGNPPIFFILDNLETSLATTVYKALDNTSGSIVERFIKTRSSKIFCHPVYSLNGPGPSMAVSGPHKEFSNSDFGIWMGEKNFSDDFCRPIRMHEFWRSLGLRQIRVEQLSSLQQEVAMRRSIVAPGKH